LQINNARFIWVNIPIKNPNSILEDLYKRTSIPTRIPFPDSDYKHDQEDDQSENEFTPINPTQSSTQQDQNIQTPLPFDLGQKNRQSHTGTGHFNQTPSLSKDWFQLESSSSANWAERDKELYGVMITFVNLQGVPETDKESQTRMMIWTWMVRSTDIPGGMFQYYHKKVEQGNVRELQKLLRASCDQPSLIKLAILLKHFASLRLSQEDTFDKYCFTQDDICKKMSHLGFQIPDRLQAAQILLNFRKQHPFTQTVKALNIQEPEPNLETVCRLMLKAETLESQAIEHKAENKPQREDNSERPSKSKARPGPRRRNRDKQQNARTASTEANTISNQDDVAPAGICRNYYHYKQCKFGKDCRYEHKLKLKNPNAGVQRNLKKSNNYQRNNKNCRLCSSPNHSMDYCPQLPPEVRTKVRGARKNARSNSANLVEVEESGDDSEEEAQLMEAEVRNYALGEIFKKNPSSSIEATRFAFDTAATIVMVMNAIYLLAGSARPVTARIREATTLSRTVATTGGKVRFRFSDERYLDMNAIVVPNLRRNLFSGTQFDQMGNYATIGEGKLTLYNAAKETLYSAPREEERFFFIPWTPEPTSDPITPAEQKPASFSPNPASFIRTPDMNEKVKSAPTSTVTAKFLHRRLCHLDKENRCRWCDIRYTGPMSTNAPRGYRSELGSDWNVLGPWPSKSQNRNQFVKLGVERSTGFVTTFFSKKYKANPWHARPRLQHENKAITCTRHMKSSYGSIMTETRLPLKLWDAIIDSICMVMTIIPRKINLKRGFKISTLRMEHENAKREQDRLWAKNGLPEKEKDTPYYGQWSPRDLRVLGCYVLVYINEREYPGVMIGYSRHYHKGYRIWVPSLKRTICSFLVFFFEEFLPYAETDPTGQNRDAPFDDYDSDESYYVFDGKAPDFSSPEEKYSEENSDDAPSSSDEDIDAGWGFLQSIGDLKFNDQKEVKEPNDSESKSNFFDSMQETKNETLFSDLPQDDSPLLLYKGRRIYRDDFIAIINQRDSACTDTKRITTLANAMFKPDTIEQNPPRFCVRNRDITRQLSLLSLFNNYANEKAKFTPELHRLSFLEEFFEILEQTPTYRGEEQKATKSPPSQKEDGPAKYCSFGHHICDVCTWRTTCETCMQCPDTRHGSNPSHHCVAVCPLVNETIISDETEEANIMDFELWDDGYFADTEEPNPEKESADIQDILIDLKRIYPNPGRENSHNGSRWTTFLTHTAIGSVMKIPNLEKIILDYINDDFELSIIPDQPREYDSDDWDSDTDDSKKSHWDFPKNNFPIKEGSAREGSPTNRGWLSMFTTHEAAMVLIDELEESKYGEPEYSPDYLNETAHLTPEKFYGDAQTRATETSNANHLDGNSTMAELLIEARAQSSHYWDMHLNEERRADSAEQTLRLEREKFSHDSDHMTAQLVHKDQIIQETKRLLRTQEERARHNIKLLSRSLEHLNLQAAASTSASADITEAISGMTTSIFKPKPKQQSSQMTPAQKRPKVPLTTPELYKSQNQSPQSINSWCDDTAQDVRYQAMLIKSAKCTDSSQHSQLSKTLRAAAGLPAMHAKCETTTCTRTSTSTVATPSKSKPQRPVATSSSDATPTSTRPVATSSREDTPYPRRLMAQNNSALSSPPSYPNSHSSTEQTPPVDYVDANNFYVCEQERLGTCPLTADDCKDSHEPSAGSVLRSQSKVAIRRRYTEIYHEIYCRFVCEKPQNFYRIPRCFAITHQPTPYRPVSSKATCCTIITLEYARQRNSLSF
jgi:hypothetical protein